MDELATPKKRNKILIGGIIVLAVVGVVALTSGTENSSTAPSPTITPSPQPNPSVETNSFVGDYISALDQYYIGTTEGASISDNPSLVDELSALIQTRDDIQTGNGFLEKYASSTDPDIKTVAGYVLVLMNDYENKINLTLQAISQQEQGASFDYTVAQTTAAQSEAQTGIIKASILLLPIIADTSFTGQDPNSPAHGPITYKISDQDRLDLTNQIDRAFGTVPPDSSNIYVFAARYLRIILTANTWEQLGQQSDALKASSSAG